MRNLSVDLHCTVCGGEREWGDGPGFRRHQDGRRHQEAITRIAMLEQSIGGITPHHAGHIALRIACRCKESAGVRAA